MAHRRIEAVVLHNTRFSETSLVVTLFSRELGRVDALAKGCRRPKSPMAGHLDLFNREAVVLYERGRGGLDLVTECDLLEEFTGLRTHPAGFAGAALAVELLRRSCMVRDPHPTAYDGLIEGLRLLAKTRAIGPVLVAQLLVILKDLGFAPRLERCAACGEALPAKQTLALSGRHGGLICADCPQPASANRLEPALVATLRRLQETPLSASGNIRVTIDQAKTLLHAVGGYAEETIDKRLHGTAQVIRYLDQELRHVSLAR